MAMRVTSKMMQGNSLSNLNTNKALQDKLTTQLSTLKKITRPSDDPVIAIRSLRLNCTVSKVDQFYEKNSKDAAAWLKLTDDSLETVTEILTNMRTYAEQASNGDLKASDRENITKNLEALKAEIYSVGNADYEGRSIFTGYRTGLPLTYQKDMTKNLSITEQINNTNFDTMTFVKTGDLSEINEGNFNDKISKEYDVDTYQIPRFRMAYNNLDTMGAADGVGCLQIATSIPRSDEYDTAREIELDGQKIRFVSGQDGKSSLYINGKEVNIAYGANNDVTVDGLKMTNTISDNGVGVLTLTAADNKMIEMDYKVDQKGIVEFDTQYLKNIEITDKFENASDDAYMAAVGDANKDKVVYIAETGELLFGQDVYDRLANLKPDVEIRVTYNKSNWTEGDLDPVHYFYTKDTEERNLSYNAEKLIDPEGTTAKQVISYDMGNNQKLDVNTTAGEVFTHDIGRDVEEMQALLNKITEIEKVQSNVKEMIDSKKYTGDDLDQLEHQLAGLDKSMTMLSDKLQKMSEKYITNFDKYLDQSNLALTKVGTREARQRLIDNRLGSQQTTFEELISSNEDADLSELAVQLSSVELTYEAALSSISYVMKTTLLDFI